MAQKIKPWILTTMEGGNAKVLSGTMLAGQEHAGMTIEFILDSSAWQRESRALLFGVGTGRTCCWDIAMQIPTLLGSKFNKSRILFCRNAGRMRAPGL